MLALAPEWGCTLACSAPKSVLGPLPGQVLDLVDHLVAAVVALRRVALGVLVGEDRARGPQHRRRREVLRRDELDRGVLAPQLVVEEGEQLGDQDRRRTAKASGQSMRRHRRPVPGERAPRPGRPLSVGAMAIDPRLPVIIGVGQMVQQAAGFDDALEPVDLMAEAVRAAATDAGLAARARRRLGPGGAAAVVALPRPGPARGRRPRRSRRRRPSTRRPGGNTPQMLVNTTAGEIQRGELDIAVLSGAECWRTRMRARKDRRHPALAQASPRTPRRPRVIGAEFVMSHPAEMAREHRHARPGVPDVRDGPAGGRRRGPRRAPAPRLRAVGPLLVGGRQEPLRLGAAGADRPRRSARRARTTA